MNRYVLERIERREGGVCDLVPSDAANSDVLVFVSAECTELAALGDKAAGSWDGSRDWSRCIEELSGSCRCMCFVVGLHGCVSSFPCFE